MTVTSGNSQGKPLALFVHGLGGKAMATWQKGNGHDFASLVRTEVGIDAHYFSYPTRLLFRIPFLTRPAPPIQLLAAGLRTEINNRFTHYQDIVLVCHSLGGLVARRYLLDEVKGGRSLRVKHLVLYATPNTGSSLAHVGKFISWRHNQLRQLCTNSDFIEGLNEDWVLFKVTDHLQVTYVIAANDRVVTKQSVSSMLGNPAVEVVVDRGHIDLVKPTGAEDLSLIILKNILKKVLETTRGNAKDDEHCSGAVAESTKLLADSLEQYGKCNLNDSFNSIKRAHDLMPTDKDVLRQYVRVCFAQHNMAGVAQLLRASEGKYPNDIIMNHWGEYYIRNGQPERAIEVLVSIGMRNEYNVEYHTGVAYLNIYYKSHNELNLINARNHLQRAKDLFSEHWWIGVNLILTHKLLQQAGVKLADSDNNLLVMHTQSVLDAAIKREPYLFSARIYRLLLHALLNDRTSFDRLVVEEEAFFKNWQVQMPKNFPVSWLNRLTAAFAGSPTELDYYKCAFLRVLAR